LDDPHDLRFGLKKMIEDKSYDDENVLRNFFFILNSMKHLFMKSKDEFYQDKSNWASEYFTIDQEKAGKKPKSKPRDDILDTLY